MDLYHQLSEAKIMKLLITLSKIFQNHIQLLKIHCCLLLEYRYIQVIESCIHWEKNNKKVRKNNRKVKKKQQSD